MIGIFDSGVGGLTVVKEVFKKLPEYQVVYFGDTARVPYGTKSEETIIKYSLENADFLLSRGARLIVIACHTASAVAYEQLREKYQEIPIFGVVLPALREAIRISKNKRIGVIGTSTTISSRVYERLAKKLDPKIKIIAVACPLFVPLIEEGYLTKPETRKIAKGYLRKLKDSNIDTLILACTHYPLISQLISKILGPKIKLINPGEELVRELEDFLKTNPKEAKKIKRGTKHQFFVSDLPQKFSEIAEGFLGHKIKNLKKIVLK